MHIQVCIYMRDMIPVNILYICIYIGQHVQRRALLRMDMCLTLHRIYRGFSRTCVRGMICVCILYNKVERFKDMDTCVCILARAIRMILMS